MSKTAKKSPKKTRPDAPKSKKRAKTAADLHEQARVERRAGATPERVREVLDQAAAAERREAQ